MKRPKFGYALLLLIFVSCLYAAVLQENKSLTTAEALPFVLGPLSAAVLWFWMISNFFANRKRIRHSACWGWSLFLASWVAAIVYFFVKYTPAENKPRDYYRKFREWVAAGEGFYGFYSKIAIVSLVVAVFHHFFMDVLYKTVNLFDYEIYRDVIRVIYFPLKAFLMFIYYVLNIDTAHNTKRLILFARTMRFIYAYLLFYIVALLLFRSEKSGKMSK